MKIRVQGCKKGLRHSLNKAVRTLDAGRMTTGNYTIEFDGRDSFGEMLPAGQYIVRIIVNPGVEPDKTFGVNGMLGTVSKKFNFTDKRKFDLGVKDIITDKVSVKIDGEDWKTDTDFSTSANTFKVDGINGIIELNPKFEIQDNADVEISSSVGLPLVNPWDVKVAPDNSIYILDYLYLLDIVNKFPKPRFGFVYRVDASGKPVKDFGTNGALRLDVHCNGIAVHSTGNLYLANSHQVIKCDEKGNKKMNIAGFTFPKPEGGYNIVGIAINEKKRLVIVNCNQTNVIYDATKPGLEGFLACQDRKLGSLLPPVMWKYYGPCVEMSDDYYYQTTAHNTLVKYKFDEKTMKFSTIWSTPEIRDSFKDRPKPDQLRHAIGIATDGTGLIYVADRLNHRIQVFFDAGETYKHISSFGSEGSDMQKCQMMAPHAVAVSIDGKFLYVADDGYFYNLPGIPVIKGLCRVIKLKLNAEETVDKKLIIR